MVETDAERLAFKTRILAELAEHNGRLWKEVWGEAHPQFNQMGIWVLLYEDSDLKEAHKAFCDILARNIDIMKPLQAAVDYHKFTDDGLFSLASLGGRVRGGNEDVFAALNDENLGTSGYRYQLSDKFISYRSTDSKR